MSLTFLPWDNCLSLFLGVAADPQLTLSTQYLLSSWQLRSGNPCTVWLDPLSTPVPGAMLDCPDVYSRHHIPNHTIEAPALLLLPFYYIHSSIYLPCIL